MTMVVLLILALLATPLLGCGEDSDVNGKRTITLGCLWDFTGPASAACINPYRALQDLVKHINEEDPIPGVELETVAWDTKYDISREIPGYDWVIERGADIIVSVLYSSAEVLKTFAERDEIPIYTMSTSMPCLEPPGWVFSAQAPPEREIRAVLKYISDQWPNYPTKPKIGWVGSDRAFSTQMQEEAEEYCLANPDKFEWVVGLQADIVNVMWGGEIEKLKDCDWIGSGLAPTAASTFIEQLRHSDSDAKLFSQEFLLATLGSVVDRIGYEPLDGSITASLNGWWSDSYPIIDLAKELLYENRADEAEDIMHAGIGYIGTAVQGSFFLRLLREAIEEAGAEDFDGQAFYNTAINFRTTFEGFEEWYYTETRRYPMDHVGIYEIRAADEDAVRVGDWELMGE